MNRRVGALFLWLFAVVADGQSLNIKKYSPEDGLVVIKSGTGITNRQFSTFSAEEQAYITGWLEDEEFESECLVIEISKSENTQDIKALDFSQPRVAFHRGETKNVTYLIKIENTSDVFFKDLELESRIFIEKTSGKNETQIILTETRRTSIAPGEKSSFSLNPVPIRDELIQVSDQARSSGTVYAGEPTVYNKDRLLGLYLCVNKKSQTGELLKVEFEDGNIPDKEKWADYKEVIVSAVSQNKTENKADLNIKTTTPPSGGNISTHTTLAEQGNLRSAFFLSCYYQRVGDAEKMEYWITKTRTIIRQQPSGDPAGKMEQTLDRMEKSVGK